MKLRSALIMSTMLFAVPSAAKAGEHDAARPTVGEFDIGLRGAIIRDAGYDPFSRNDWLSQLSLGASRRLLGVDAWSFHVGARWDYGERHATARGADSSLVVHRLAASLEGRYQLSPRLLAFVRLAPGAMWQKASIADVSSIGDLAVSKWVPSGDLSLGSAFLLSAPRQSPLWSLVGEVGYGWSPSFDLNLQSSDDSASTNLGTLATRGPFFRLGARVGF